MVTRYIKPSWFFARIFNRIALANGAFNSEPMTVIKCARFPDCYQDGRNRCAAVGPLRARWVRARCVRSSRISLRAPPRRGASKGTGPRYARFGRHVLYRLSDVIAWEKEQLVDAA
jgi:hypothetical protein